jgi:hypothetical protein
VASELDARPARLTEPAGGDALLLLDCRIHRSAASTARLGHCVEQVAAVVAVRSIPLDATMSRSLPITVEVGGFTWVLPLVATGAGAWRVSLV